MAAPDVSPQPPRILIVDDSRIVRATIAKHVKARFDIVEAADGESAWEVLVGDGGIRTVISDLSMPRLDGYGLLTRIRGSGDARIRALPVIIISGDDEAAQKKRASKLGATDFITKGISAVELLARLDNLTQLNQVKEELDSARELVANSATTDSLTRQGTMALLVKQGAAMFSYARRHHVPLSVVRILLDDYASVRERLGVNAADQVLTAVAKKLASRLRREDVIARIDGAEFAIAAPAASAAAAARFSQRLAKDIRGARISWQGQTLRITASIGIADSALITSQSFADVLAAAGRRLERARELGGDRVVAEDVVEAPQAVPEAPTVEQALALIASGRAHELKPFAEELAIRIYPLVKFCDEQFTAAERQKVELTATQRMALLGQAPPIA